MTRPLRLRAPRWSRWRCAATIALLALAGGGCKGPKIPAGNLKELKEKKRELKEAQRRAEQDAAAAEGEAAAPPAAASAAPAPSAAATPVPPATDAGPAPLAAGSARVTLRTADGGTRQLVLRQPLVGRWERTFLTAGGVRDRSRLASEFGFRDGTGRTGVKIRKLARVEWIAAEGAPRSGVRLRFHFRRADRPPEEFAAEDLLGAEHPVAPFLLGIDPRGAEVRLPLYPPIDRKGYEPIVEVEFGEPG